jgi:capsular exopolysaccharide synthesis family protein
MVCLALAVGVVMTYETLRPERFQSFAQLYLGGNIQMNVGPVFSEESSTYFGTQIEILKSARVQAAAYAAVNITIKPDEPPPIKFEVVQPLKASVLILTATGPDPNQTQQFLEAVVSAYLDFKQKIRLSSVGDAVLALTEQVAKKEKELKKEQDEWADFQRTNNIAVLEEEGKSAGLYLAELGQQEAKLKLERGLLERGINPFANDLAPDLSRLLGRQTNGSSPELSAKDAVLKAAKMELAVAQGIWMQKTNELPERHPAMRKLADDVSRLEIMVANLEEQDSAENQTELGLTDKRISALEASVPAWEARVQGINERLSENQRRRNDILRDQTLYDHLLATLQTADLSKNVQQEPIAVLVPPTSAKPEKRYLPLRIILAIVTGLFLSCMIVFGWQLVDSRFVSVRDVTDQFGEMVLGLVPRIRIPRSEPRAALLAPDDHRYTYLESFRRLRSALLLSSFPGVKPRTLLFTSVANHEGKTTIVVNLAMVLARSGLKVVLVDTDSRSRSVHPLLDGADKPGLMEYLQGEMEVPHVVYPTEIPGLSFVPIGAIPDRADGLFLGDKLGQLLSNLRETWEYVILDTPPILASDDTSLMIPQADAVLLVVRPFSTRSRMVRHALEMLHQRRAKQVTIILNEARGDDIAAAFGTNGAPVA